MKRRWVCLGAVAMLAVTAGTASADSPDSYVHTAKAPPPCANSGATPDSAVVVCGTTFGVSRTALSSQFVVVTVGDAEGSHADCAAGFDATTHTLVIDGIAAPITVVPCRFVALNETQVNPFFRGHWAVFYRYLINPGTLAPGSHTITFTTNWIKDFTFSLNCTDPSGRCTIPAGSVQIDTGELVIQ
jgi:hypothetical protein